MLCPDTAGGGRPAPPAGWSTATLAVLACLLALLYATSPAAAATSAAGSMSLDQALEQLSHAGLQLIYSSATLHAEEPVTLPPATLPARERLTRLLAPLGLRARLLPNGSFVIERDRRARPRAAPTTARRGPPPLEQVLVEGRRLDIGAPQAASHSRLALESDPVTAGDATRVLQLSPAVSSAGYTVKSHVRGSRDDETLFWFDGVELSKPFHLQALPSLTGAIDPAMIDSATTWTGAKPVQYAGALGGAVDYAPRTVDRNLAEFRLSNNGLLALGGMPIGWHDATVLASARLSNTLSPAEWLESGAATLAARDYLLRITLQPGPATRLAFGALQIEDELTTLRSDLRPDSPGVRSREYERYLWGRWWQEVGTRASGVLSIVSGQASNDSAGQLLIPLLEQGELQRQARNRELIVRDQWLLRAGNAWSWILGATYRRTALAQSIDGQVTYLPPFAALLPMLPLNDAATVHARAGEWYASAHWQRGERQLASLGVRRIERSFGGELAGDAHWDATAAWRAGLSDDWALSAAWSIETQAGISELAQAADGRLLPQPARRQEQRQLGLEGRLRAGWHATLDLYDKRERTAYGGMQNLFDPLSLLPEIEFGSMWLQGSAARMRGIEITLDSDAGLPLAGWLRYAHTRAEDRIDGRWLPRSWDQPDALEIGGRWQRGAWRLTARYGWHAGWPRTPLLASANNWQDPASVQLALGERNSLRHPPASELDLGLSWDETLPRGALRLAVDLFDATNAHAPCCDAYGVTLLPDGSHALIDQPGNWLAPFARLTVRWQL